MLKKVAFAGCLLAGAGCLFADDLGGQNEVPFGGVMTEGAVYSDSAPDNHSHKNLGSTTEVLWDNGDVSYSGIQIPDGDPIDPAMVIFDNGGDNYTNGFEITFWRMAENFVLKSQSNIQHIDFSVLDTNAGSNLGNWEGIADWTIYADAGGAPGAVVASGAGTNITAVFDQMTNNWDFWDFGMDLDVPQCLDAGTYWLGLHLNRLCDFRADLYWGITDPNGTAEHHQDTNCSGNFEASSNELSFSLSGTDGCGGGGEVCLDFEDNAPCVFSQTNPLRGLYAGQGVNFAGPSRADGGAILDQCGNFGVNARSGVDFLAFNRSGGQMLNGGFPLDPETVTFDSAATDVSVWVSGGSNAARWKMDAFDVGGNLVTSGAVASNVGAYAELTVSGGGIRSVVVTETSGAPFFVWDDFCVTFGSSQDCLDLRVTTLTSGQSASWNVSGATPGAEVAIVYGTAPGNTSINGFAGYCADFGIKGVTATKVICRKNADGGGNVVCKKTLPGGIQGLRVLSQAAERNTCPDTCMSNLDDQIVQ